ncbi:hypothetical protein [Christiangramia sp. SM2212]|uniref:Ribosomal protein L32 n=1 Tax=Christiangramia sediminicola TaxID=3073267 RepID=A0ABU1ENF1_9FLAO|nr:hypothetical protein [Christiangramia sp. SM2212]MDR5589921.1 hypothetical protein [Christiangramia sp. SM2212]
MEPATNLKKYFQAKKIALEQFNIYCFSTHSPGLSFNSKSYYISNAIQEKFSSKRQVLE